MDSSEAGEDKAERNDRKAGTKPCENSALGGEKHAWIRRKSRRSRRLKSHLRLVRPAIFPSVPGAGKSGKCGGMAP